MADHAGIMDMVENAPEVADLTPRVAKELVARFERCLTNNLQLRVRHAGDPMQFMDSEVELHDVLQEMHVLATAPSLFGVVYATGVLDSLGQVLAHENNDIAGAVVSLLADMTDSDVKDTGTEEETGAVYEWVVALARSDVPLLMVQSMARLDEHESPDDEQTWFKTLAVVENMIEWEPAIKELYGAGGERHVPLVPVLLRRLQERGRDANKNYAAELLAVMAQNGPLIQALFASTEPAQDGGAPNMDLLLQAAAPYRKRSPEDADEEEYIENVFDLMASVLLNDACKGVFCELEGIELLVLVIKGKKYARAPALKALASAVIRSEAAARRLIDVPGLGTVFGAFMRRKTTAKAGYDPDKDEEHAVSIISSLLYQTSGTYRLRTLNKFCVVGADDGGADASDKVERLAELHAKYLGRMMACDEEIERERQLYEDSPELEELFYLKRLESGLFTLQLVDFVIGLVCTSESHGEALRPMVASALDRRGLGMDAVKAVLTEYGDAVGDDDSAPDDHLKQTILSLPVKLEAMSGQHGY